MQPYTLAKTVHRRAYTDMETAKPYNRKIGQWVGTVGNDGDSLSIAVAAFNPCKISGQGLISEVEA